MYNFANVHLFEKQFYKINCGVQTDELRHYSKLKDLMIIIW